MGYSENEAVIRKVQPILDQMVEASTDLSWPTTNAHMFGYHLREAMNLAKDKKIAPYENLKDNWIIRNKGTKVVAEKKRVLALEALQATMSRMELGQLFSVVEIVGAAITHKAHHMYFPDAAMMPEDRETLYQWCQKNGYFLVVAEIGVTLTKDDPGEAAWSPV